MSNILNLIRNAISTVCSGIPLFMKKAEIVLKFIGVLDQDMVLVDL
jgi:hypothetical protein